MRLTVNFSDYKETWKLFLCLCIFSRWCQRQQALCFGIIHPSVGDDDTAVMHLGVVNVHHLSVSAGDEEEVEGQRC